MSPKFEAVSPNVDIDALEKRILDFWQEKDVFQRTMQEREGNESFVFYEGPPTANGKPGSHHVLSRAFKDLFPRYKTMNGYYVLRKGGWDTHGLPVEIAVEKELGINHKSEIEEYGIAEFNEKCRDSVFRLIQDWNDLTERIAFWVDLDEAYVTYRRPYIESVWWILQQFWDKGLIYQGYKVVPYCPRCGTPLSSHEVSQGYAEVDDPSVYVRFRLKDEEDSYLLAWTTTPWTLPGNAAVTVGEKIDYVLAEGRVSPDAPVEKIYVAKARYEHAVLSQVQDGGGYEIVAEMKGTDLLGKRYEPLYNYIPFEGEAHYVTAGDYVTIEDGSGLVHTAPAFGEDDLNTGHKYNLPVIVTVNADGKFKDEVEPVAGLWFKDADKVILRDLKERGLLFKRENYRHNYPHCWRDKGPLMYYARDTWYIRTTDYRDKLVGLNNTINWVPEHIQQGRFGNWLENVKDWALGRERYWGTPLPVWVADDPEVDHMVCVGSVAELEEKTGRDLSELDLHRPYVDEITWEEEINGKTVTMRRVPELIDVWFDSGAMPVAQWGYPHMNQEQFESQFPADYICEAVDQTRGWFYSLHAIATMLFESVSYKNVICLGHILADDGTKMSKSKGNIVEPWAVLDRYGADAMRWYMFTANPPGEPSRMGWRDPETQDEIPGIAEVLRNFYLKLWNTYSFFVTYANIDNFDAAGEVIPVEERDLMDRWILSELNVLVKNVTDAYETYDVLGATRPIETFVDDLSNWYLRRSRRRFWQDDNPQDKLAAYQTLHECLLKVGLLLAPSMPFLSEALYQNLAVKQDVADADSVHLANWVEADEDLIDEELNYRMQLVKRMVSLGHAARNEAGLRVRQPLQEVFFAVPTSETHAQTLLDFADTVADELNVKSVKLMEQGSDMVSYGLKPVDTLGRELRKDFPAVRKAIVEAEGDLAAEWGRKLLDGETIQVEANGQIFDLSNEQVIVKQTSAEGYAVAEEHGYLAALTTELTPELVREGQAREIVRRIQTLRKDADFELSDRIALSFNAEGSLVDVMNEYKDYICAETLADEWHPGELTNGDFKDVLELDGETIELGVHQV